MKNNVDSPEFDKWIKENVPKLGSKKTTMGELKQNYEDDKRRDPLATEMLQELKDISKRKDKIIIILVVLWFMTILGFIWYLNQPGEVTETSYEYTQEGETEGDNSAITQRIGELNGESKTN